MKILHVFDHSIPVQSGYASRSRYIIGCQRALGLETEHVTGPRHPDALDSEETIAGIRFYRTKRRNPLVASVPLLRHADVVLSLEHRLHEVIAEEKPDILHAHSPALAGLAAVRAGRRHRLPVLYEVRATWEDAAVDHGKQRSGGLRYRLSRGLETRVLNDADAVTTICEGLKREIVSRGVEDNRITVIPNAVDIRAFRHDQARDDELAESLGLSDATVIGYIGSFYNYEGLHVLIEAASKIVARDPSIKILLVGGGPEEKALRQLARRSDVAHAIHMTGRIPHNEVRSYYSLMDLCVYPRLSMRLTEMVTPLKPLEAMAMGKNVVATDIGGHRELISDGETGVMCAPGDPDALADSVRSALGMLADGLSLGGNARQYVIDHRTWQHSVARYLPVYEGLLGNGAS